MPKGKPAKKKVSKTSSPRKRKKKIRPPTMAQPQATVTIKPEQKPKYNVLGQALGVAAKALDEKYLGGAGRKIWEALTGSGDYVQETKDLPYDITANTVVHPTLIPVMPSITNDGGMVRVRHREYVTDVSVSNVTGRCDAKLRVQPGNAFLFPWLSGLGRKFQQYKLLGGVFEYVTLSGNAVSAKVPALGQAIFVANYDVARILPTPLDTREALNTYYSNSGVISADLMMALECETTEQPCQVYNVRNTEAKSQPVDLRWYDFAEVRFEINGAPVDSTNPTGVWIAGQIWFTYDILLLKPVIDDVPVFEPLFMAKGEEDCDGDDDEPVKPVKKKASIKSATRQSSL